MTRHLKQRIMKIDINNLIAQMQGRDLTIHQRADAFKEFNKLIQYVEHLEQLASSEPKPLANNKQTQEDCEHPFAYVMSKCNGEINKCLKCGKQL